MRSTAAEATGCANLWYIDKHFECGHGETGRRKKLKISRLRGVRVRAPLPAPLLLAGNQGAHQYRPDC